MRKMANISAFIISMSITGSIIGLIVMLLKHLLRNKISWVWQYFIWIIVFIRLLLPFNSPINLQPLIEDTIAVQTANQVEAGNVADASGISGGNMHSTQNVMNSFYQQVDLIQQNWYMIGNYLFFVAAGGAAILAIKKIRGYNTFRQSIELDCRKVEDDDILSEYYDVCLMYAVKKPPQLYYAPYINTPMTLGIFQPKILLPTNIKGDIRHIFFHELTHYKRHDIFYKLIVQTALCVHWFNPLVWLFARKVEKDCELACDEKVVMLLNERRAYGDTLLATINSDPKSYLKNNSLALNKESKFIKERLDNIMKFKLKRSRKLTIIITVAIICVGVVFGYTVIGNAASSMKNMNSYVLKYKTDNYQASSVYDFDHKLLNDYDALYKAFGAFGKDDPEKDYYTSLTFSMVETKKLLKDSTDYPNRSSATTNLIEGNRRNGDYLAFLYNIWWNIHDMQSLTVSERDQTLLGFRDAILQIINQKIDEGAFDNIQANDYDAVFAVVKNDIDNAADKFSNEKITVGAYATNSAMVDTVVNGDTWKNRYSNNKNLEAVVTMLVDENSVSVE
jgi:beta-lactamase regulating signal transducer with metallopeptidase domain